MGKLGPNVFCRVFPPCYCSQTNTDNLRKDIGIMESGFPLRTQLIKQFRDRSVILT